MDYDKLLKMDKVGGGLSREGLRRITDRITGRLRRKDKSAAVPEDPARILVIKLWGIGNMILAGRAFKSLRDAYPEAQIVLLTTPECLPVYEGNQLYNDVVTFSPRDPSGVGSAVTQIAEGLAARAFDLVVNLEGLSELASAITRRVGAAASVGMVPDGRGTGAYTKASPYSEKRHVEDLIYDCALAAGGREVPPGLIRPAIRPQDRGYCDEILSRCDVDQHTRMVGFNINAGEFALERRWPMEKFALLAQMIEAQAEFRTVFFGNARETRTVNRTISLMETPGLNVSGMLSLRQFMAFVERLHLLVTNDSGPLHVAAALGVPTVAIFGPESPARVGRRDVEEHAAIYKPASCSPCLSLLGMYKDPCRDGARCVHDIPVDEVRFVVMDMLDHLSDPEDPPWMEKR